MNKLKSLLKAVIYVRVSSEKQIDNFSLDTQEKILRSYAESNSYQVVKVFREEGKSGTNTNRPQYQEMMKYIQENHVDAVIVHKLDRLHREMFNTFTDKRFFNKNNIRFIAVADGIDTFNEESNLLMAVQAVTAEQFSRNLSKETRKGLLAGAENCLHMGGIAPYGFKVNHDNGMLEIDETTAPAVRQIFSLYVEGFSSKEICKWLKEHGYKTSKGNDFKGNTLNSILHNEKYRGCYTWDKAAPKDENGHRNSHATKDKYIKIEDGCPRIVSDELFAAAQERLVVNRDKASRAKPKRYYPLNGRIFCSECKSRMTGSVQYSSGKPYYQYKCSKGCGNKAIRADKLENCIFDALRTCLFCDTNKGIIIDTLNQNAAEHKHECDITYQQLKSKYAGLETAQNNLMKAIETNKATTAIMNRLERISGELEQTEYKIRSLDRTVHTFKEKDLETLQSKFNDYMINNGTVNAKRFLNSIINRVEVSSDKVYVQLSEGISINKEIKNEFTFNMKGNKTMKNNRFDAILTAIEEKDENTINCKFVFRTNGSISYNNEITIGLPYGFFFSFAERNDCDIFSLVGAPYILTVEENEKHKIVGIKCIDLVA